MDGAGAALREAAAEARIVQAEIVAQSIEQRHVGIGIDRMDLAIDVEGEFLGHGCRSLASGRFCRGLSRISASAPLAGACGTSLVPHTGLGNVCRHQNNVKVSGTNAKGSRKRPAKREELRHARCPNPNLCARHGFRRRHHRLAGAAGLRPRQAWKHALLNAKADAGFFMMSAKRGFAEKQGLKLELLQVKDDQIGAQGAYRRRGRQLRRRPAGRLRRRRARRRRQDHRLSLGGGAARHLCA